MEQQLVLILLVGAVALIQWIWKKSRELRAQREERRRAFGREREIYHEPESAPPRPAARRVEDDSADAMRRLREALGLPDDSPPPRRVQTPPPVPPEPPRRPPTTPKPHHVASLTPPVLPSVSAHPRAEKPAVPPPGKSRVRELLASSGGLRDAVILSEILGRPKGAQI